MSDEFYPQPLEVPGELRTDEFVIRPLTPAHVALDYAALMESKAMLRLWSGSPWPQDNFTLRDNLADLVWHDREHRERIAFTYTVLNPGEDACLGCIYIKPLSDLLGLNRHVLGAVSPRDALVRFWITAPALGTGLDARLLTALRDWFAGAWAFERVFFHTRTANAQQVALFEAAGLRQAHVVKMAARGGTHYLFD